MSKDDELDKDDEGNKEEEEDPEEKEDEEIFLQKFLKWQNIPVCQIWCGLLNGNVLHTT